MSQDWDMPFDQVVEIFQQNHEANRARRSSACRPSHGSSKGRDHLGSVSKGSSSRGSGCLGLGSSRKSSPSRPCSLVSVPRKSLDERHAHDPTASPAPISANSIQLEEDVPTSNQSMCLGERPEGSDRLTPLQQVKKAISATSSAIVRISSWSSNARKVSFDSQPSLPPPLEQGEATFMSSPLHRQSAQSPSPANARQIKSGLSRSLNSRMPDSTEKNAQSRHLKPCLSRSLDRNTCLSRSLDRTASKLVSFQLPEGSTHVAAEEEGPWDLDTCARSSDRSKASSYRSRGTPTGSGISSCNTPPPTSYDCSVRSSNTPPPINYDCSARSSSTRSRSSAGTYFFRGTLGRSRRTSSISEAFPTPEQSQAGDGNAAQEQAPQHTENEVSSELEFYQFAKPFDLSSIGLEGEEATYSCSPPGDEGDAAIADQAGCVVRRVKARGRRRARRNGYMLEAEQVERSCTEGAKADSWPVKLADAIHAIPPRFVR